MKRLKLLLIGLLFSTEIFGSHVIGGDIFVEWVSTNNYRVTITVFRDCNAFSTIPSVLSVGIYDRSNNSLYQTLQINPSDTATLAFGDACFTPTGLCVEQYTFVSGVVNLPDLAAGYYFQTQIYARSNSITNLLNPGSEGMSFYAELADPALGPNTLPDFGIYPMDAYLCIGANKDLDLNVSEIDGDSLVFSLVDPLGSIGTANGTSPGPYNPVVWDVGGGFGLGNIVGGTPPMSIDPQTGIISANAGASGIYVFAVRVEEFRNGIKIGETQRDIAYAALNCIFDLPPLILSPQDTLQVINLGDRICIDMIAFDQDAGDTLAIGINHDETRFRGSAIFQDPNNNYSYYDNLSNMNFDITTSNNTLYDSSFGMFIDTTTVARRYCWQTTCGDELTSPYRLEITAFSIGCGGTSDTIVKPFYIDVQPITNGFDLMPNVFTPNGDGLNDFLKIDGIPDPCYDFMDVKIYNRWGQTVFESDDAQFQWDGKNKQGNECPNGTYFVVFNGKYGGDTIDNSNYADPTSSGWQRFAVNLFRHR